MFPWGDISGLILGLFPQFIINPLFWLVTLLVINLYRRGSRLEEQLFGVVLTPVRRQVLESVAAGLVGGVIGSFILTFLGVSLSGAGIIYVWPVAILLMLLSPRLLCFAYAGGIVSLSHLVFGFPQVEIPQLMALVAVLHLMESVLMFMTGHRHASPVYVQRPDGQVVGGYNLQKFWPIPVVVMLTVLVEDPQAVEGLVRMPDWWPLLRPQHTAPPEGQELIYSLFLVTAALGYTDVALASSPRRKARKSAVLLGLFSVTLLAAAVGASFFRLMMYVAALWGPLGHEAVVYLGSRGEFQKPPLFSLPERGVQVLALIPGRPGEALGLESGETILEMNGKALYEPAQMHYLEDQEGVQELVTLQPWSGEYRQRYFTLDLPPGQGLGIIHVPTGQEPFLSLQTESRGQKWWKALKRRLGGS